jgi:hypothetical protein
MSLQKMSIVQNEDFANGDRANKGNLDLLVQDKFGTILSYSPFMKPWHWQAA